MDYADPTFAKKLNKIVRRHRRLSNGNGVVHKVTRDGLIVASPRMYKPRFPLASIAILIAIGFVFKGFLYASLGEAAYTERATVLADGTMVEKVGAWIMQADIATVTIAQVLGQFGV